ncbi:MAG: hypothetical protein GX434_08470 [Peptococcaceae bacterium]|nr:hypothetical protein [Peptococcaceae bacterium]
MSLNKKDAPKDSIRERLLLAINDYKITLDTISKVTRINIDWLSDYINRKKEKHDLSIQELGYLWEISVFLSEGMKIVSEDERIKGVIDILVQLFGLGYETISLYSGLEEQDIENFMKNTDSIDYEKKYKLAIATMMLHYLFKNSNNSIQANN